MANTGTTHVSNSVGTIICFFVDTPREGRLFSLKSEDKNLLEASTTTSGLQFEIRLHDDTTVSVSYAQKLSSGDHLGIVCNAHTLVVYLTNKDASITKNEAKGIYQSTYFEFSSQIMLARVVSFISDEEKQCRDFAICSMPGPTFTIGSVVKAHYERCATKKTAIVVGAGIIGLSAALLLKNDYNVIIIERNSQMNNFGRKQVLGLDPATMLFLRKHAEEVYNILFTGDNAFRMKDEWGYVRIGLLQQSLFEAVKEDITILWNTQLKGYFDSTIGAFAEYSCRTTNADDSCNLIHYPFSLLVGADGTRGVVKDFSIQENGRQVSIFRSAEMDTGLWAIVALVKSTSMNFITGTHDIGDFGKWEVRGYPAHESNENLYYLAVAPSNADTYGKCSVLSAYVEKKLNYEDADKLARCIINKIIEQFSVIGEIVNKPLPISSSVALVHTSTIRLPLSNAIMTVQGDSAHRANFITGSGANAGFKGLEIGFVPFITALKDNATPLDNHIKTKIKRDGEVAQSVFGVGIVYAPYLRFETETGMALTIRDGSISLETRNYNRPDVELKLPPILTSLLNENQNEKQRATESGKDVNMFQFNFISPLPRHISEEL